MATVQKVDVDSQFFQEQFMSYFKMILSMGESVTLTSIHLPILTILEGLVGNTRLAVQAHFSFAKGLDDALTFDPP